MDANTVLGPALLRTRLQAWLYLFSGSGARQGYLAAIDQGVISLANFLATIILARNVSPTELGVYGVGFITLRLARALQEGLVVQPLNVYGAPMPAEEFRRYVTSTALIQVISAAGCSLAMALGGWLLIITGNDTAGPAIFVLWFAMLWWLLQEFIRRILYTRGAILSAVVNTVLANLIRLAIMLWWARRAALSGTSGMDAIGWGSLAALLPGLWLTRAYWTRNWQRLGETWKQCWSFGRWVLGGSLANWVAVEFYPVLTAGMISFAAAGAYRALQNLVAPIHLLLRALDTYLTPRAARLYEQHGRSALARLLRLTYWTSGAPILGTLLLAMLFRVPLLRFLYGDTYLAYSNGMVWMAVFYALWFAYWPLQTAFKAIRRSQPIFSANLAAVLAMFTVGLLMIRGWGVYGTIAGQALNSLLVNLVLWGSWLRGTRRFALHSE